jgi:4-hydroxy-tetrahydrodipicolinate reductase
LSAPLRIGVLGAFGRMGRLVVDEIKAAPDLELAWAYGREWGGLAGAQVIVDFSTPEAFARLMTTTTVPVVSGTTGLIPPADPPVALFHAANFSVGVAVLARLVRQAHQALPDWDIEVVELHHHHKRDAPSGTALRLVEGLGPAVNGRKGLRVSGEVGLHAVRGGDIVGEHQVYLCGQGERLQLAHVASHRGLFASGAIRAARWIYGRSPGLYGMEHLIA